jgi:hypothetical protein
MLVAESAHAQARPLASPNQKRVDVSAPGAGHSNWAACLCSALVSGRGKQSWIDCRVPVGRYRSLRVLVGHRLAPDRDRLGGPIPPAFPHCPTMTRLSPGQSAGCARHHGRRIIPTPQNAASAIFHGSVAQISLDPAWRMNRLSSYLFLVLSHICITSIHGCT